MEIKNKRILVIAAHPDDELLGLGATLHRLIHSNKCEVRVVILGEGITSRAEGRDRTKWEKELEQHKKNITKAQACIGYHSVGIYDLPDNRFDTIALLDIVKIIEKEKESFKPDVIFTHHGGDTNIDHRRTFEAVITASRPMEHESVKTIITFETPSSTEWQAFNYPNYFQPNLFFKISEENLQAKTDGMDAYEFERRDFPHPRSGKALRIQAQRWGVVVGAEFAEAFVLIRDII